MFRGGYTGVAEREAVTGAATGRKYGDDGIRTHDLRLAKPALSQLSYIPGDLENTPLSMPCQESAAQNQRRKPIKQPT